MKILYKSDTHGTAKTPTGRIDNYPVALLKKMIDIGKIIKDENIEFVIDGGDLFHSAKISLKYAGAMSKIMKSWGVPIYVVPGSHDVYDYNYENISNTMLGFFEKSGIVKVLRKGDPERFEIDGFSLYIEGQEHLNKAISNKNNIFDVTFKGDLNILIVHDMLVDKPMPPNVEQFLLKDIETEAEIILSGHYHPGYGKKIYNNTTFYNPGSFGRVEYRDSKPECIVFDIFSNENGLTWTDKFIPLPSALNSEDLFDLEAKESKKLKKVDIDEFKETLKATQTLKSAVTLEDIIEAIAKNLKVDIDILDKAKDYIEKARLNDDEKDLSINGFVEKPYKIFITDVEIENFQSHENSIISFTDGFNAIIGETAQGKTSILRAMKWCIANEPKGSDFIRTGEKNVRVRINFSDGTFVERERTVSSAGVYRVKKLDGIVQEYSGFNTELPIDVINTHQMPEVNITKDIQTILNIQDQLDGPFGIKESPANKAFMIGRLIGVQNIDSAIKEVSKDLLSNQKEAKKYETDLKNIDRDLDNYKDLDDLAIVIKHIEDLIGFKEDLEKQYDKIQGFQNTLDEEKRNIINYKNLLSNIPDLNKINQMIKNVEIENIRLSNINSIDERINNFKNVKTKLNNLLNNLPKEDFKKNLIKIEDRLNKLIKVNSLRDERLKYYKEIQYVNEVYEKVKHIKSIDNVINYVEDILNKYIKYNDLYNDYTNSLENIRDCKDKLDIAFNNTTNLDNLYFDEQLKFKEYLNKVGTCPTCGAKLNEEHMEHIIKN